MKRFLKVLSAAVLVAPALAAAQGHDPLRNDDVQDDRGSGSHFRAYAGAGALSGAAIFAAFLRGSDHSGPVVTTAGEPPKVGGLTTPLPGVVTTGTTSSNTGSTDDSVTTTNPATTSSSDDNASETTTEHSDAVSSDDSHGDVKSDSRDDDGEHPQLVAANTVTSQAASTAPEPSTLALIGTGIIGLAPMLRRRRK